MPQLDKPFDKHALVPFSRGHLGMHGRAGTTHVPMGRGCLCPRDVLPGRQARAQTPAHTLVPAQGMGESEGAWHGALSGDSSWSMARTSSSASSIAGSAVSLNSRTLAWK